MLNACTRCAELRATTVQKGRLWLSATTSFTLCSDLLPEAVVVEDVSLLLAFSSEKSIIFGIIER